MALTDQKRTILENRKKLVWDSLFYANQRLDLLIISISGGGLYACSDVIKNAVENKKPIDCTLKIVPVLFVLAIIINIISQKTSAKIHEHDFSCLEFQLDDEEHNEETNIEEIKDEYEKRIEKFNSITNILNELSLILMFAALLIFIFYLFFTF